MFLGQLAAIVSAALWAFSSLAMAGLCRRLSAVAVSALRLACGVVFYLTLLVITGQVDALFHVGWDRALALGGTAAIAMGLGDTIYVVGMQAIGVSRASPISVTAYPLITIVLAAVVLGETITAKTAGGGALVVCGIVLIVLRPQDLPEQYAPATRSEPAVPATVTVGGGAVAVVATAPPADGGRRSREGAEAEQVAGVATAGEPAPVVSLARGVLLVLLAAALWAVSTVWLRNLTEHTNLIVVNAVRVPVAAAVLWGFALSRGLIRPRSYRRQDVALLIGAGFVGSGLGSLVYVYALREAGAGRSALLNSLSPLFALPLAALFLGERVTRLTVAGTVLALAGVWLVIG